MCVYEHRGDFTQEADLVRRICGANGGYETTEVRGARRMINSGWSFLDNVRDFGINAD